MRYAQLLCLIWFLLEVHFQTGNVLPLTQSLGMRLSISFTIILLPRSDIICVYQICILPIPLTAILAIKYTIEFAFVPGQCNFFNHPVLLVKLMQCSTIANGGHRIEVYRRKC